MKFKVLHTAWILMATLCLAACSVNPTIPSTTTATPSQISSSTTAIPVSATAPPPALITSTTSSFNDCRIIIKTGVDTINGASGKILLSELPSSAPLQILDIKSWEQISVSKPGKDHVLSVNLSTSLDREWFEYTQMVENTPSDRVMHIVDANGVEHKAIRIDGRPFGSLWLNDNKVLVETLNQGYEAFPDKPKGTLWLVDPFTGEKQKLQNEFPDQFVFDQMWWDFPLARTIYNSTLTRAIYPTVVEYKPSEYRPAVRLVNMLTGETLADVPSFYFAAQPRWSPDGSEVAFIAPVNDFLDAGEKQQEEVLILSEDGEYSRATHFAETSGFSSLTGVSWSTNRKIAVWVNNTDAQLGYIGAHLSIVNLATNEIQEFCRMQTADGLTVAPQDYPPPTWSPDNNYLLVNLIDPNKPYSNFIVAIVDIATKEVFQIAENKDGIGWLK